MNILITSPRAPIVLDWIEIASRIGEHQIKLVDSLYFPIARFSKKATYQKIPAPRTHFKEYQTAMKSLIAWADIIIPTCEDIFYLSQIKMTFDERAKCLMPNHQLLFELHHKFNFFKYLPNEFVKFPKTTLIRHYDDIVFDNQQKTVLKPVYSRFGRSVIRGVNAQNCKDIHISERYPWVQQAFIEGAPLCNYAICEHGKVVAHAIYRPKYLLNQSASTYFEPIKDDRLEQFIQAFAKNNHYHGQVAFDFIDDGKDLYVLECNPRATSGLHLVSHQLYLDEVGQLQTTHYSHEKNAYRVGVTLPLLFGKEAIKQGTFSQLIEDYKQADDVLKGLSIPSSLLSLGEMVVRKLYFNKPLTSASTFDIEFDGFE